MHIRRFSFLISSMLATLALLIAAPSHAQTPATVNLTATPTSGNGVINVSLNWTTSPAATGCAITGGGVTNPTAATAGTATDSITKTTTYAIACNWTRTSNTFKWIQTLNNTDGSPLTDLAGYNIWWNLVGATASTQTVVSDPKATSAVITPPAPGTYAYVLQACNVAKLCSLPTASLTGPPIGTVTATATATTTVTPIPQTPTGVTIQ